MVTIYELLEVEEDASKEEIEKAYSRLVLEFRQDIKFDSEKNKENEMIVNRLKLAYEILIDDEKRRKYDYQLAQKRAENLLENISVSQEKNVENDSKEEDTPTSSKYDVQEVQQESDEEEQEALEESDLLTENEKNKLRKAAKNEFKKKLKKAKQAEEEYKEAYNKAYNDYLRKNGYAVKEPWTFRKVKRTIIATLIVILFLFILWCLPPIKKALIGLYEENFIIKTLVDIIKMIIDTIFNR